MRHGLVLAIAVCALSACGSSPSAGPSNTDDVSASSINVATPAMVAKKAGSGIQSCPAAQTKSGGLPHLTLKCLGGGRSVDLSTLKGPLIINIFQSACGPCLEEAPAVAAFYKHHGAQYPMLGIDGSDTVPGAALNEAIAAGVTYPLVADPGDDLGGTSLNYLGYPTWYFLAADGTLTKETGPKKTEAEILAMVTRQFGPRPSSGNHTSDDLTIAAVGIAVAAGGAAYAVRRRSVARRRGEAA
ncbi:hypothetical protein Back2_19760 [Nocardioides baekrokdamisoli]|uniref:Redoxin domain-containing protein n=1 Tax=Nocardioides baekrokdamisoli TaxID=1804624 RepID=A0A3G9J3V4_9ACTN|nr:TlpA disulfide reductase family protein [Nocardioides baekrokdamisoli]BBH17689.1 hypothetical protein Back2_19760 [Nocardioides baekrokdamisoli]